MIGLTNTRRNGFKDTNAILIVSVPTGSTVTATKNGITLIPKIWVQNAPDTCDSAIFSIPSSTFDANAWTVTATLNEDIASNTITIDSAKEYELELNYDRVLFYNGTVDAELGSILAIASATVGTEITTGQNPSAGNYWCSNNKFVVTAKYTTLNFEAKVSSYNTYAPWFGIAKSKLTTGSIGNNRSRMTAYTQKGTTATEYVQFTVDISSYVNNSYYIAMCAVATTATKKIWLTE